MTDIAQYVPRAIRRHFIDFNRRGVRTRGGLDISFKPGFALALCKFDDDYDAGGRWTLHIHLGWPNIFVRLPWLRSRTMPVDGMLDSWGFSFTAFDGGFPDAVHLNWGHRTKILRMPWAWEHHLTEVQRADGSWAPRRSVWCDGDDEDGRHIAAFPYIYALKSGEVQRRTATVYVHRIEWRWRWFQRLPWPRLKRQSIDVRFDDEVGERAGSWKGGCIGCSYEMLPGETVEQTLRRMERERKF